jgi:uncharacterized protein (TIGR03382 family)
VLPQDPMRTRLSLLLLAVTITPAAADVNRCATAETDLAWTGTDVAEIAGDTGWFPSGYVAQLRLTGRVLGHTTVETGVRTQACWGDKMEATLAGRPGGGWLDVAYGAEVSLRGRIHTSVLGRAIDWEGNIPLPHIPMDLLLAAQTTFDPAIDATKISRVSDAASAITLLTTDVIGDYISIIGIAGGLRISVTPSMVTTFRTKKATVAGGTIDSPGDKVTLTSDGPRGFGGGLEVPIQTEGVVRYEPALKFNAGLQVTVLGYRIVDWTLFSVPMNLPPLERTIKLTGASARLALPVLEGIGDGARMDFATGTVQELAVRNLGEAPLAIEPQQVAGGALISRVDLAPGGQGVVKVFVADDAVFAAGPFDVTLATNDPDRGAIKIQLGKAVGGTDPGTPPDEDGEAGGCSAGGTPSLMFGLLALLVIRRRRSA